MPLRFQNTRKLHDRVPSYYVDNKLYPGAYTNNRWPSRTSRRIHDGMSIDKNYGLDTVSDDVNSSPYSSPYYVNGRYHGTESATQRGNSSSVQGIERLLSIGDYCSDFTTSDQKTVIEMWQGKQIKFEMDYSGRIVGQTISIKNTGGCTGILSIYLSAIDGGPILSETSVDLCEVSMDFFEHFKLYSNNTIQVTANPQGKIYVRMEIWDEISMERSANPFNTGRKIEIAATGLGNHDACVYKLGEKNMPVSEEYNYERYPNRPCMAFVYNDYIPIPVNRVEETDFGATVSNNQYRYDIFCYNADGVARLLIYDKEANEFVTRDSDNHEIYLAVDGRSEAVNLVQANDYVYYVDGYSVLQKFKIGEWGTLGQDNIRRAYQFPARESSGDGKPAMAASIICKHNNRIYLSGFRYDRNFAQLTAITSSGPNYDNFLYEFYVPDNSPLSTSINPITAIVEYENDTLMIANRNSFSLYSSNVNVEDGTPEQVSSFTDGGGVRSSGDITNYRGVIYSFDPDEGIRRFTGSVWKKIPHSIDSHIERVDMTKPRKLWGYADKLYLNYTDALDGVHKCLIWDTTMNYQQFPWFQDIDLPFCDIRHDDDYDLIGIHCDYPCILRHYAKDVWKRLDSPIIFERHTKFISIPGNAYDMVLKRVHNKVLANANRWWFFALSWDEDSLYQSRGQDKWYRMPCWDTEQKLEPIETPFPYQDEYESRALAKLTLPGLRIRAISVQEKVMCKTFREQAGLVSTVFEAQAKTYH